MDDDRWVVVRGGGVRRAGDNPGTRVLTPSDVARAPTGPVAPSIEEAFLAAWPTVVARARSSAPGLIAVAVDDLGVAASVGLAARVDRPVSAIVGRHASTDLYLPDDATLSLRHLAILVLPCPSADVVRYRVLDLRSGLGFEDEHHRPVHAIEADGPTFLHLGRYTLALVPVRPEAPRVDDPAEAWRSLPPRAYVRSPVVGEPGAGTAVQVVEGPSFVRRTAPGEARVGILRVSSPRGATAFAVGERSARSGILLGRYDRCDNAGLLVLDHPHVSRVHLLLVDVDGALYAIDTGSTNGVRQDGATFRERALGDRARVELGRGLAEVEWLASR